MMLTPLVRGMVFILALASIAIAQLPDAPSTVQPPVHKSSWRDPWVAHTKSNWDTLRDKSFLWTSFAEFAGGAYDAEITHAGLAHHQCVEGNPNLGPHPSRASLYEHNIPEQLAMLGFGFVVTKAGLPKWLYPGVVAYPVSYHLYEGSGWLTNCW